MTQPERSHIHQMYLLLQECGEDAACGCGCEHDDEDEREDAKPKKKAEKREAVERVVQALAEARRKHGLRQFRRIRRVSELRSGKGRKVLAVRKTRVAIRRGAVNNRHR